MRGADAKSGLAELRAAARQSTHLYLAVAVFSLMANLLMLTGPLYMMQLYDRVLFSGSVETLVALTLLMVFLYAIMGLFDFVRGQVLDRAGLRFFLYLQDRVFHAALRRAAVLPEDAGNPAALANLQTVQKLINSQVLIAGFDLPWVPIFLLVLFAIHPLMGVLALIGGAVLILLTLLNQFLCGGTRSDSTGAQHQALAAAEQMQRHAFVIRALGMTGFARHRWQDRQSRAQAGELRVFKIDGALFVISKTLRMILASGMLGLGAWLVLGNQMSAGGMFAGSILMSRVLAPIDTILTQWPLAQKARESWQALAALLSQVPQEPACLPLPEPKAEMQVKGITVVTPGGRRALLKSISFAVQPGQAVGVIGPSGAGKSTLARALVGTWPLAGGSIRLGGAALDQYGPDDLGRHIGYLPQSVTLFDGTLAENIGRLDPAADEAAIVEAAQAAGAHELILSLPQGYDTRIQAAAPGLSGGQLQRIGLARALYRAPVLLVLDEPNANLDWQGAAALNSAIKGMKARGGAIVIMTHRAGAIKECDMLLLLEEGQRMAFGPREDVMGSMVKNANANRPVGAQAVGMQ